MKAKQIEEQTPEEKVNEEVEEKKSEVIADESSESLESIHLPELTRRNANTKSESI